MQFVRLDEEELERFLSKTSPNFEDTKSQCWIWYGALEKAGYGSFNLRGKTIRASRLSFLHFKDSIPSGMMVCHTCDIKRCINPEHLFLGTMSDNVMDSVNKGLVARGEKHVQAKLSNEQVVEAKELYRSGLHTQKEISQKYGVCAGYMSRLINGHRRPRG